MSIPFNNNLLWDSYHANPDWHKNQPASSPTPLMNGKELRTRAVNEIFAQTCKESLKRSEQFIRDSLRLVLKVPVRSLLTPVFLPKNWKERERAKVNVKLTGYSFVQLASVPAKFFVAIMAILASPISTKKAQWLLDKSDTWTARLDGRASQLEALKEVGRVNAKNPGEFISYKNWLYSIKPELCRK